MLSVDVYELIAKQNNGDNECVRSVISCGHILISSVCLYVFISYFLSFTYLLFSYFLSLSPIISCFFLNPFSLLRLNLYLSFRRLFYISFYHIPYLSLLAFLPRYPLSIFLIIFLFSSYVPLSFLVCRLLLLFFLTLFFSSFLPLWGFAEHCL